MGPDQLLQGTPFGPAALALQQRGGQLESAMGDPSQGGGASMGGGQPPQGGMSQPQFSGYGQQMTPQQKMAQQQKLMMLLRMRQQPQGQSGGY